MKYRFILPLIAMGLLPAASAVSPAQAAALISPATASQAQSAAIDLKDAQVTEVQYRRRHWRRGWQRPHWRYRAYRAYRAPYHCHWSWRAGHRVRWCHRAWH